MLAHARARSTSSARLSVCTGKARSCAGEHRCASSSPPRRRLEPQPGRPPAQGIVTWVAASQGQQVKVVVIMSRGDDSRSRLTVFQSVALDDCPAQAAMKPADLVQLGRLQHRDAVHDLVCQLGVARDPFPVLPGVDVDAQRLSQQLRRLRDRMQRIPASQAIASEQGSCALDKRTATMAFYRVTRCEEHAEVLQLGNTRAISNRHLPEAVRGHEQHVCGVYGEHAELQVHRAPQAGRLVFVGRHRPNRSCVSSIKIGSRVPLEEHRWP